MTRTPRSSWLLLLKQTHSSIREEAHITEVGTCVVQAFVPNHNSAEHPDWNDMGVMGGKCVHRWEEHIIPGNWSAVKDAVYTWINNKISLADCLNVRASTQLHRLSYSAYLTTFRCIHPLLTTSIHNFNISQQLYFLPNSLYTFQFNDYTDLWGSLFKRKFYMTKKKSCHPKYSMHSCYLNKKRPSWYMKKYVWSNKYFY